MIRQLTRPLLRPLTRPLLGKGGCERWVYNFDGVNDFAQFAQRLIDPDGDIDIEWEVGDDFLAPSITRHVISQFNGLTAGNFREFYLRWQLISGSHSLMFNLGGVVGGFSNAYNQGARKYRINLEGSTLSFYRDGALIQSQTFTRGSARQPSVPTVAFAAWPLSFAPTERSIGTHLNLKINGHLYPIDNPASAIQTSVPDNGNPLTLVNTNSERWSKIPC